MMVIYPKKLNNEGSGFIATTGLNLKAIEINVNNITLL